MVLWKSSSITQKGAWPLQTLVWNKWFAMTIVSRYSVAVGKLRNTIRTAKILIRDVGRHAFVLITVQNLSNIVLDQLQFCTTCFEKEKNYLRWLLSAKSIVRAELVMSDAVVTIQFEMSADIRIHLVKWEFFNTSFSNTTVCSDCRVRPWLIDMKYLCICRGRSQLCWRYELSFLSSADKGYRQDSPELYTMRA